jgi:hypothetical protein
MINNPCQGCVVPAEILLHFDENFHSLQIDFGGGEFTFKKCEKITLNGSQVKSLILCLP